MKKKFDVEYRYFYRVDVPTPVLFFNEGSAYDFAKERLQGGEWHPTSGRDFFWAEPDQMEIAIGKLTVAGFSVHPEIGFQDGITRFDLNGYMGHLGYTIVDADGKVIRQGTGNHGMIIVSVDDHQPLMACTETVTCDDITVVFEIDLKSEISKTPDETGWQLTSLRIK